MGLRQYYIVVTHISSLGGVERVVADVGASELVFGCQDGHKF